MTAIHEKLDEKHQFKIYGYKTYRNSIEDFSKIKISFNNYLKEKLEEFSGKSCESFSLENYHRHTDELKIDHHDFIKTVGRKVPHDKLDLKFIDNIIQIANNDLDSNFRIYKSNIEFRVVRPDTSDNNERHRDHWFPYFF